MNRVGFKVSEVLVAEVMGGATATEAQRTPSGRRQGGILFADVHGYSRLMEEDEDSTHRLVSDRIQHFRGRAAAHGGEIVHVAGDGFAAFFEDPLDAVEFALEVQETTSEPIHKKPQEPRVQFRVGINAGEVISDADGIYGDSVNIAARLEKLATPGGTCVSDAVFKDIRERLDVGFEYIGPQNLHNMAKNIDVYRVHPERICGPTQPQFAPCEGSAHPRGR